MTNHDTRKKRLSAAKYDPFMKPSSPPAVHPDEGSQVCIQINEEYVPYICSALWGLTFRDKHVGTPEQQTQAANRFALAIAMIQMSSSCEDLTTTIYAEGELKIGDIIPTVNPVCGDNRLLMDGSTYAGSTYPDLFAVIPASWKTGSNFTLPDMNNAGLRGAGTLGAFTGDNDRTLGVGQVPDHTHNVQTGNDEALKPLDVYPTSGNRFQLAASGVGVKIDTAKWKNTGGVVYPAGTSSSFDNRDKALSVRYCIIAKTIDLSGGTDGNDGAAAELRVYNGYVQWRQSDDDPTWSNMFPVPSDGAPGAVGPPGPEGDCDCDDIVDPSPPQPPLPAVGATISSLDALCGGARRVAQDIIADVNYILEALEAIIDTGDILIPDGKMKIGDPITSMVPYFQFLSLVGPAVIFFVRSEVNSTDFEDDLTCELFNNAKVYGNFIEDAYDDFKAQYFYSISSQAGIELPTNPDMFIGLIINFGTTFPRAYDQWQKGSVNADAYCANFCSDNSCDTGLTPEIIDYDTANPNLVFTPPPTVDGFGNLKWPAGTQVRAHIVEGPICLSNVSFTMPRSAGLAGDSYVHLNVYNTEGFDSNGGAGAHSVSLNIDTVKTAVFTLRLDPDLSTTNWPNLIIDPDTLTYTKQV